MEETRLLNRKKIESIAITNISQRAHFMRVNNKIVLLMGECLVKNSKYDLAYQLYDLSFDAVKVFEVLDLMD